jgi:hypothetical protein
MNMLGDKLRNVPKNYQLRSPFESRFCLPGVPLTKALALMKKIKQDTTLHRSVSNTILPCKKIIPFHCNLVTTLFLTIVITNYILNIVVDKFTYGMDPC